MRPGPLTRTAPLLAAVTLFAACEPAVIDVPYQGISIRLRGPDPDQVPLDSDANPFKLSASYEVTLRFFEDEEGRKPYGDGVRLPQKFEGFSPEAIFGVGSSAATITPSEPIALPRLGENQGSFWLTAEVLGLNSAGQIVARGRCPLTEIRNLDVDRDASSTVVCAAFFGVVGRWNPVKAPLQPRRSFAATALADGRVVIAGGRAADASLLDPPLSSVEVFDPAAGTWRNVGDLPGGARTDLTATATETDRVLFVGGTQANGNGSTAVDLFDPQLDLLASALPMSTARALHGATLLSGETIVAVGGRAGPSTPNASAEQISPTVPPKAVPAAIGTRNNPCVARFDIGKVLLLGGSDADVAAYTYASGSFTLLPYRLQDPRPRPECAALDGIVYVIGGSDDPNVRPVDEFREASGFVRRIELPESLLQHSVAAANGKVIVAGGVRAGVGGSLDARPALASSWWFDNDRPQVFPSESGARMTVARADHRLVALPDGTVMAVGGRREPGGEMPGAEILVVPDR